jgi:hypothetical protein
MKCQYAEYRIFYGYAECHMMSVVMLNVVILGVIMLSVVAP